MYPCVVLFLSNAGYKCVAYEEKMEFKHKKIFYIDTDIKVIS